MNFHPYKGTSIVHAVSGYQYVEQYHESEFLSLLSLPNNQYEPTAHSAPTPTYMRNHKKKHSPPMKLWTLTAKILKKRRSTQKLNYMQVFFTILTIYIKPEHWIPTSTILNSQTTTTTTTIYHNLLGFPRGMLHLIVHNQLLLQFASGLECLTTIDQ